MSRSINLIQAQILNSVANDPTLSALNSSSLVAIYRLWAFIVAASLVSEEQLNDLFVAQVENQLTLLPPATPNWIQGKSFEFQYNDIIPQVIQFDTTTFVPKYPTVVPAYRLITNCSVTSVPPARVIVKVAKGSTSSTPQPLTTTELQSFQNYWNTIKPAGINYNCVSEAADRLASEYKIYYQGGYSSVIQATLLAAYKNYLFNIPFGGVIKKIDIDMALRNVPGVVDLYCEAMTARPNTTAFGGGTRLCLTNTVLTPEYTTSAGYIIDETESGWDFLSNLTLVAV